MVFVRTALIIMALVLGYVAVRSPAAQALVFGAASVR